MPFTFSAELSVKPTELLSKSLILYYPRNGAVGWVGNWNKWGHLSGWCKSVPEIYERRGAKVLAHLSMEMQWGRNKIFLVNMNRDSVKYWGLRAFYASASPIPLAKASHVRLANFRGNKEGQSYYVPKMGKHGDIWYDSTKANLVMCMSYHWPK